MPLYQIKEDSMALQRWHELMPGYTIKGFEFDLADEPFITQEMKNHYKTYGWVNNDGLHCRTRAVWDSEMLFISTKRIDAKVDSKHRNIVYTTVIDYSKKGLQKERNELFWRVIGESNWNVVSLNQTEDTCHFFTEIPYHKSGTTIEYYVSAVSKSGRKETQPRTAPIGTYTFFIK